MKLFLKILSILLLMYILVGLLNMFIHSDFIIFKWLIAILNIAISMPLKLIDKSYPFYTNISLSILLSVLNLLLQTSFIIILIKFIKKVSN